MTYNQAIYESNKKWRTNNKDAYNAYVNSWKIKNGSNKIYAEKKKYFSYDLEAKRQFNILL